MTIHSPYLGDGADLLYRKLETVDRGTDCVDVQNCPICGNKLRNRPWVDMNKNEAVIDGQRYKVQPVDAEILHVFFRAMPRVVSKTFLMQEVWGLYGREISDDVLHQYIYRLKLFSYGLNIEIETLKNVGVRIRQKFDCGCPGCGGALGDGLYVDYNSNKVVVDGTSVQFTEAQMAIFVGIICAKPHRISGRRLAERVYGHTTEAGRKRICVHITHMRRRLKDTRLKIDGQLWHGYDIVLGTKQ